MELKLEVYKTGKPHVFHVVVGDKGVPDYTIYAEDENEAAALLAEDVYDLLDHREDVGDYP